MTRILLLFVLFCGAVCSVFAQSQQKPMLNIGGELGLYTGSAHFVYGAVAGSSAQLELPLPAEKPLYVTITSGYNPYLTRLTYNGSAGNLFSGM